MNSINELTKDIIGAAIAVHEELGPGLLESVYEKALKYELELRGHVVDRQCKVAIVYKGVNLTSMEDEHQALRFDLVVDHLVCVELKSVEALQKVHFKQLYTYLHFLHLPIGLLFNFNVCNLMKEGFGRVAN